MKKLLFALVMLSLSLTAAAQQKPAEKDMGAYLFTYFSDATHSLFMAISYDGYNFTPVNHGQPIISGDSIAEQRGIRDPHIYRAPNGKFYIAMTDLHIYAQEKGLRTTRWERDEKYGWGNNRGLVLMASDDLIHWTHHEARIDLLFPERFGDLGCAWAPQTIWDPAVGKPMVYFTILPKPGGRLRVYYSYADEAFTTLETEPQLLFDYPDEKVQVLDADICPMPDGRYFMTYVAQENPAGIKYMISDRINHFDDYHAEQIDTERGGCEAPNVWKRIGEDKWVVMYDIYSLKPHNFGFVETTDFKTFTPLGRFNEGQMKLNNFTSPKHGCVIPITKAEAARLENYWNKPDVSERPKIGLVFGGGGAKGAAEVGVLKVLEEAGIKVDYIAGTSIGSIVGGLYAAGYTARELETMFQTQEWLSLLTDRNASLINEPYQTVNGVTYIFGFPVIDRNSSIFGVMKGESVEHMLDSMLSVKGCRNFKSLPIPFRCVTADIRTAQEIVLSKGPVSKAMRASMSIPGIFKPVKLDDRLLVDGGMLNNLPVDVCRKMGADIVIAIDLQQEEQKPRKQADLSMFSSLADMIGFGGILEWITNRPDIEKYLANRQKADIYIHPDLPDADASSFGNKNAARMIQAGVVAAKQRLPELQRYL